MPTTTGMKGAGFYDQHSTAQLATIHALQSWIAAAATYSDTSWWPPS
jgi:hypothetical protein